MALRTFEISVGTTPTLLYETTSGKANTPTFIKVRVPAAGATVTLGGNNVVAGVGFDLVADKPETFELTDTSSDLYGRVAAATQVVEVLVYNE